MINMELSELKNEDSCITKMSNRLPNYHETLVFDPNKKMFSLFRAHYEEGKFIVEGKEYPFTLKFPNEEVIYPSIAFDVLLGYFVTYKQRDKIYLYFYNDLTAKQELKEIEGESSYICTVPLGSYKDVSPEVLLILGKLKEGNTEVSYFDQKSRFNDSYPIATVKGDRRIRVAGITSSNRFLVRFFDKVELV